jgi:hypothetical protein
MRAVLAYIDAGSGSLLVQLLVGGLAGLGAFAKFRWHEIRARFRPKKSPMADPPAPTDRAS